ncbi:MAG: ribosome biogenesis factor YjgA [Marinicella sp.]
MSRKSKNQPPHDSQDDEEIISKTQKKRMVHELQELAKTITAMPKKKVAQLDLPAVFTEAIEESKRITSHIARKRHFQYMGKILLRIDHEAIQAHIEQIENLDGHYQIRDTVINLWVEHLATHEKELFEYLYQYHEHDVLSQLRQTLRNHRKKPDHVINRKKLFQALRSLDKSEVLPNPLTIMNE